MDWLGHQESRMIWHSYHLRQDEARRQMDKILSVGKVRRIATGYDEERVAELATQRRFQKGSV